MLNFIRQKRTIREHYTNSKTKKKKSLETIYYKKRKKKELFIMKKKKSLSIFTFIDFFKQNTAEIFFFT